MPNFTVYCQLRSLVAPATQTSIAMPMDMQAIGGDALAGLTQHIVGRCRANAGNGAERRYFTERAVEPK